MNMFKKNGGFTLIELIVVIAILAILAGVAVPAYSGYINKANKTADDQSIEAIETAMSAALAMEGKNNSDATNYFNVYYKDKKLTVETKSGQADATDVWNNFTAFYGNTTIAITLKYYNDISTATSSSTVNPVPALLGVNAVAPST